MANETTFTPEQMRWLRSWQRVQAQGRYNMLDPRARSMMSLSEDEHLFVFENYEAMAEQAERKELGHGE